VDSLNRFLSSGSALSPRQHVLEGAVEEIAETDVRKRSFCLGRPRCENVQALVAGPFDAGAPERRLPDPRLAFQDESLQAGRRALDEGADDLEVRILADDFARHLDATISPGVRAVDGTRRNQPSARRREAPSLQLAAFSSQGGISLSAGTFSS